MYSCDQYIHHNKTNNQYDAFNAYLSLVYVYIYIYIYNVWINKYTNASRFLLTFFLVCFAAGKTKQKKSCEWVLKHGWLISRLKKKKEIFLYI